MSEPRRRRSVRLLAWTGTAGLACWAIGLLIFSALFGVIPWQAASEADRSLPRWAALAEFLWRGGYFVTLGSVALLLAFVLRRRLLAGPSRPD